MQEYQVKPILTGMYEHIMQICPFKHKIGYLQISAGADFKDKTKYRMHIALGAGWYMTYNDEEQEWFHRYMKRVAEKYPDLIPDSLCGYTSGSLAQEQEALVSMEKLARQMNNPQYIAEKGE